MESTFYGYSIVVLKRLITEHHEEICQWLQFTLDKILATL